MSMISFLREVCIRESACFVQLFLPKLKPKTASKTPDHP